MRAGEADGAGDAIAIFAQAIEGRIGVDGEIHFRAGDQIVEIARGHVVAAHGVDERGEDFGGAIAGLPRRKRGAAIELAVSAGDGFVESGAPFGQAALLGGEIIAFVGDVVDQAHESVERGEAVALGFRQQIETRSRNCCGRRGRCGGSPRRTRATDLRRTAAADAACGACYSGRAAAAFRRADAARQTAGRAGRGRADATCLALLIDGR